MRHFYYGNFIIIVSVVILVIICIKLNHKLEEKKEDVSNNQWVITSCQKIVADLSMQVSRLT
jgi:hypothetical protein